MKLNAPRDSCSPREVSSPVPKITRLSPCKKKRVRMSAGARVPPMTDPRPDTPAIVNMLPKSEKDRHAIEKAARLRGTCWGEEYERMISGMLYSPLAPELIQGREKARRLIAEFNAPPRPDIPFSKTVANREATLQQLFGHADDGVYIEAPLFIDYGCNTSVGKSFYANFNLTILDCGLVTIGDYVEIGPNVNIITDEHYTEINARRANRGKEFTGQVVIGNDCWIGGNVTILAGVTIGEGCTIGAGSVVKKDIPPFSIAVGSPARVIRSAGRPEGEGILEGER